MLRKLTAWLLLAWNAAGAHALGLDVPYERFATPDAVRWVQLCGTWGAQRDGVFRVVHAEHLTQSFIYLQWMQRDAAGDLKAVHTQPVAELDNDHAEISLVDLGCRATPRGIVVTARASSGHDDRLRRVMIEAGPAPGQYRYREQRSR